MARPQSPRPARRRRASLALAPALGLTLGLLLAAGAAASPETLRRSVGNIALAPLDLALAPVVAGRAVYTGLRSEDDPLAVRIGFVLPGFAWNTGVQGLASVIREIAGLLELLPGVAAWAWGAELQPIYDPAESGPALVDVDTPPLRVRIGIDYTSLP